MKWQKRYGKDGLVVIAIMPRYLRMDGKMLKKIVKGMGINYRLARWEKEQSKLPKPLSLVPSYPASLLIDRQGKLRGGVFGPRSMQLEEELEIALKGKTLLRNLSLRTGPASKRGKSK